MLVTNLLIAIAAALPVLAQTYEGGECTFGPRSRFPDGVCVPTWECDSYKNAVYSHGACPGTPDGVKCCRRGACAWVNDGMCPGGEEIKQLRYGGRCTLVFAGMCPGPSQFRWVAD